MLAVLLGVVGAMWISLMDTQWHAVRGHIGFKIWRYSGWMKTYGGIGWHLYSIVAHYL